MKRTLPSGLGRNTQSITRPNDTIQATLLELASRQHGIVCRRQLMGHGLTVAEVRSRVEAKMLIRLYPGTYALGHRALTARSRWMAAVLFAGPTAVLSHRSAAALFGIIDSARTIEVTRKSGVLIRPGLTIHSTRNLRTEERVLIDRIPVASPTRTLIDLAGIESSRHLDDRLSAASRLGLLDCAAVRNGLDRVPNSKGPSEPRRLLGLYDRFTRPNRSELENRFLRLCLDSGLPLPEADVRIGSYYADLLWRKQCLIAEIDSRGFHLHRLEEDRIRDIVTLTKGYRTIRVTNRLMETDPSGLVDWIRALLSGGSNP